MVKSKYKCGDSAEISEIYSESFTEIEKLRYFVMDEYKVFPKILSLQRLCNVAIAAALWESDDVKKFRESSLKCGDIDRVRVLCPNHWNEDFTNKVLKNAKALPLVKTVIEDLEKTIIWMGQNKYAWTIHVYWDLRLAKQYSDRVFWTSFGMVDEAKIMLEYWLKKFQNQTCNFYINNERHSIPLSFWACVYTQESIIEKHELELKNVVNNYFQIDIDNFEDRIYSLISLMLLMRYKYERNSHSFNAVLIIDEFLNAGDYSVIHPNVMLEFVALKGYFDAVKYYWGKLNTSEQLISASSISQLIISALEAKSNNFGNIYDKIKLIKILSFLINEMPSEERKTFIITNINTILKVNALIWPFQEISFFDLDWIEWDKINYTEILGNLGDFFWSKYLKLCSYSNFVRAVIFVPNGIYIKFFEKILEIMPKDCKVEFFTQNRMAHGLCEKFYVSWLKLLLNDSDLKHFRGRIIMTGTKLYERLFQLPHRHKYVMNLLHIMSDDEQKNFINSLNFKEAMKSMAIWSDGPECVNILNWFISKKEHLSILDKSNKTIDQILNDEAGAELCLRLTKKQNYSFSDKFLNWMFESEEEKANWKVSVAMENSKAVTEAIFYIWKIQAKKNDISSSVQNCSEFLIYYLGTEEEVVKYKKEKLNILESEKVMKPIYRDVANYHVDNIEIFDDLLEYLLVPEERIAQFKNDMRANMQVWINKYFDDLGLIQYIFNWLYDDEDERKGIIENYLESEEGLSFCKKLAEERRYLWWGHSKSGDNTWFKNVFEEKINSFKKK